MPCIYEANVGSLRRVRGRRRGGERPHLGVSVAAARQSSREALGSHAVRSTQGSDAPARTLQTTRGLANMLREH